MQQRKGPPQGSRKRPSSPPEKTEEVAAEEPLARTFAELELDPKLVKCLEAQGWTKPTPIQAKAIPPVLARRDIIGVAQTGTGKTGAFLLPIAQMLQAHRRETRALILEPTRELALQVGSHLEKIAEAMGLKGTVVYGGSPIGPQRIALKNGVDILVATPGRLIDICERMFVSWRELRFLVLDEADRMLDMGFLPDIEKIMRRLPMARQSLLFTATMPTEITRIARDHMLEPIEVTVGFNRSLAEGITEWLYPVREDQKTAFLLALLEELHIESGLIFCRMKIGADRLGQALRRRGHNVGLLHADRPQVEREATLQKFRDGEIPLIVATDVASRGLDVTGISHVINHDVPESPDDYIHRAGRTARAGDKGDVITLVSPDEERSLAQIERLLGRRLERSVLADFDYRGDPLGRSSEAPRSSRGGGRPRRSSGGDSNRRGGRRHGPGHSRNR